MNSCQEIHPYVHWRLDLFDHYTQTLNIPLWAVVYLWHVEQMPTSCKKSTLRCPIWWQTEIWCNNRKFMQVRICIITVLCNDSTYTSVQPSIIKLWFLAKTHLLEASSSSNISSEVTCIGSHDDDTYVTTIISIMIFQLFQLQPRFPSPPLLKS